LFTNKPITSATKGPINNHPTDQLKNPKMLSQVPLALFSLLSLLVLLQLFSTEVADAQSLADGSASGTILGNLWRRRRQVKASGAAEENSESQLAVGREKRQWASSDGSASGTILSNLWGRRKRWADGLTSGSILSNMWRRRRDIGQQQQLEKRQKRQWADGTASGTILSNLWGRRKRWTDGSAQGSILQDFY